MRHFRYHEGQRAVQTEANSRANADNLVSWVGPAAEFSRMADLIVMASTNGVRKKRTSLEVGWHRMAHALEPESGSR